MGTYGAIQFIIALMGSIRILETSNVTAGAIDGAGTQC